MHGAVNAERFTSPSSVIPAAEQDTDGGRSANQIRAEDGQAVVDLLNQPDVDNEDRADTGGVGQDLGTSSASPLSSESAAAGFEDVWGEQSMGNGENVSLSDMLYGRGGTVGRN